MDTNKVTQIVDDAIRAAAFLKEPHSIQFLQQAGRVIADAFLNGGKVIAIGNGGSLCDAAHFTEELTGFFRHKRAALPAIVINDPSHLTCVSNDIGYENVFSRGVEAYGKPGDVLISLTTSGNSPSIVKAVDTALQLGLTTISFLGKGGGVLKGKSHLEWIIEGFSTSDRIQEAHMAALHIIIEIIEFHLFVNNEQALLNNLLERNAAPSLS